MFKDYPDRQQISDTIKIVKAKWNDARYNDDMAFVCMYTKGNTEYTMVSLENWTRSIFAQIENSFSVWNTERQILNM